MNAARLYRVILPVTDIDVAVRFYGCLFGSTGQRVTPGRHYFDCGGVILACYDPVVDGDSPGEGWMYHENQYLYFAVPDVELMRRRVEQAGGKNLTEIEDMPWGERLFYAEDPMGGRISFVDQNTLFTRSDSEI